MFYDIHLLRRGGKFGLIWIAGTRGIKALSPGEVRNVNTYKTCDDVLAMVVTPSRKPTHRLSLYLASKLFHGVVRIHFRQAELLLDATLRALSKIRKPVSFTNQERGAIDVREKRKQRKRKIVDEVPKEVQPAHDITEVDVINVLERATAHIARTEQITLVEPTEKIRTHEEPEFGFEEDINFIRRVMEHPGDDIFHEPDRIVAPGQRDLDQIIEDIPAVQRTPALPELFAEPAAPAPVAEQPERVEEVEIQPQPKRTYTSRKKKGAEIPFITSKKRTTKKLTKEIEFHNPALMLDENENLLMSSCFRYPSLFDKFVVNELVIFRDSDLDRAQGSSRKSSKSLSIPRASKHRSASPDVITPETSKDEVSGRAVSVMPSVIEEVLPPIAEQIPGPIETEVLPMETTPLEPRHVESPPRVDRDRSPLGIENRKERLKQVLSQISQWYNETNEPLTIEDIAEKPLTRMTVAVAFSLLLDLCKREYVVLKPLENSTELGSIELWRRFLG